MAVRGINYKEGTNGGYESVYIHYGEQQKKVFASGNFVKDWYYAMKWFILSDNLTNELGICNSSSVDHFIMDGAPYDSVYLLPDSENSRLSYNYDDGGLEFFVPKGTTPTWKELKKLCDDSN